MRIEHAMLDAAEHVLAITERGAARWLVVAGAMLFIVNLFYLGAKPFAVGLFLAPWDKLAHLLTFGFIAALLWLGWLRGRSAWVVILVCLIGAADELHQHFLPGRAGDPFDLLVDLLAAFWTVAILNGVSRAIARRRERG